VIDAVAHAGGFAGRPGWWERRRLRRQADAWLLRHPAPARFAWRVDELTSRRERHLLARSLRGVVRGLSASALPSAVPLNRAGLRPYAGELAGLADRLDDSGRPVGPTGVLLVQELLSDGGSPLYDRGRAGEIPDALAAARAALETR